MSRALPSPIVRRRLRGVPTIPRPLTLLLAISAVLTVAWSVGQPPFQGPDEVNHFAYTQRIVEQRDLPWRVLGSCRTCRATASTEVDTALVASGMLPLAGNLAMKDLNRAVDERAWARIRDALPADAAADGGYQETMRNGPVYYLYEAVPYAAFSGGDIFTRAFAMRLANLPLVLVLVAAAWALTGLVLGPRRWLQTLAAGVVALNAQVTTIGASINADMLLAAAYAVAIVLMALVLTKGPTRLRVAGLLLAGALGPLSHPRGVALLIPVAVTLVVLLWRVAGPHDRRRRRAAAAAVAALAVAAVPAILWAATAGRLEGDRIRAFGSYLWGFYLPRPGFIEPVQRGDWGWRDVFVDRFWGVFAQFDVIVASWVLDVMAYVTAGGLVVLVAVLVARRGAVRRGSAVAVVLALSFFSYLLAVHVSAWRLLAEGATDPILTGRYFLPFVVLIGLAVAVIASWLPRRLGPPAAALVLSCAFALQLASLGALLVRYYAA